MPGAYAPGEEKEELPDLCHNKNFSVQAADRPSSQRSAVQLMFLLARAEEALSAVSRMIR